MIAQASGIGTRVGRFSRQLRGVGVLQCRMRGWMQCDALNLLVRFLRVLVYYDCWYLAQQLEYLSTVTVYRMGWKSRVG